MLTWHFSGTGVPHPFLEDDCRLLFGLRVDEMLKVLGLGYHVLGNASLGGRTCE